MDQSLCLILTAGQRSKQITGLNTQPGLPLEGTHTGPPSLHRRWGSRAFLMNLKLAEALCQAASVLWLSPVAVLRSAVSEPCGSLAVQLLSSS